MEEVRAPPTRGSAGSVFTSSTKPWPWPACVVSQLAQAPQASGRQLLSQHLGAQFHVTAVPGSLPWRPRTPKKPPRGPLAGVQPDPSAP